jgi:hypothetical protein
MLIVLLALVLCQLNSDCAGCKVNLKWFMTQYLLQW